MLDNDKNIPDFGVGDLDRLYKEGEECDKRMFSEMRTNLQLVAGEHYFREGSKFWNRIRDDKQLSVEQRLKLTKNHIQRVTKIYRNQIEQLAPDVGIEPANENEYQDQKAAELNTSYWQYVKECNNFDSLRALWAKNFVEIGEVLVKIQWDMNGGQVVGYEAMMQPNPITGQMEPMYDPNTGGIIPSNVPVYGGRLKYTTVEAYNLRRDPNVRTMDESPYLILASLNSRRSLNAFVTDKEELSKLQETPTEEWNVFDNNTGSYRVTKDQVLIKEIYYRPAPSIPNGYYFIWCNDKILSQGELPYGIFPLVWAGFEEQTGNPRAHSIIRHIRPPQIEINRCASKMAEHQITVGDDKIWVPANSKVSQGALLPGIRVGTYTGVKPEFQPGRAGDQYLPYLEAQIQELYSLAHIPEAIEEQPDSPDLYTYLFRSARFKQKFSIYGQKFERFIVKIVETSLRIARASINEAELIPAIGKSEYMNVAEFKSTEELHYQIKIKPRCDDIETQFGQQLVINHTLQYVGNNLEKEDIGQMLRLSPFLNNNQMFRKFTQKYDSLVNLILSLDRGQYRPMRKFDDHDYIIAGLSARMAEASYDLLPPPVKMLYERVLGEHEQAKAVQMQELQRAQQGFIPSGGYLVACDFYVPTPTAGNPSKVTRVRLPSEAIAWLIEQLKVQGTDMAMLEKLPGGVLQDISARMAESSNRLDPRATEMSLGGMNAA